MSVVLLATSPFGVFLWHRTSFYPQDNLFPKMQVVRNFCLLAVFSSCRNLTLQHAQRADIFNVFLIYSSCFGWTRELLAPLFPFLVLPHALNTFPARLIYFFLQRASENLFHFQIPNRQIPNFFWTMSLYTSYCISSYPKAG